MQRNVSSLWFALAVGLLGAGCTKDAVVPTDPAVVAKRDHESGGLSPTTYAVIGDVPYGATALTQFPDLIEDINDDPDVQLTVHVGDIKSGSTQCTNTWFQDIADDFATFSGPLVYSIGDNEWTDCHRANNGGYNPIDRLAKIREIFFATPGKTLGGEQMSVDAEALYPENQRWSAAGAVFATFHVIGSNNGRDRWYGDRASPVGETATETASREAEYLARNDANLEWLSETFKQAKQNKAAGIVLFLHADLWHPEDRAGGAVFTAHTEFVKRLSTLANGFKGPILIISGDSHDFRVDPGVPWFSLYGAQPPSNVTQIIVDRSIEDDLVWLKLRIDPGSVKVFSWEEVKFVPTP